ncbi:hypothetical protein C8R48DRAFT_670555 [Suillus tomentosus]|nr:hypothetical protein C8R48DRAFT_670555 [Suillus tomentosus]
MAKARDALQTRLMVKLRNDFGNSKIGRRANAAGNTIVSKLIGDITIKSGKKKSRPLNATEVYAKKYYSSRVQPAVKEELDAMKNAVDAPEPKKRAIQVVRKQLASCWENESAQVKEEVTKLAQEMKEKREKEKEAIPDKKEVPKELLTKILSTFFTELHDSTGWTFSVLLAGPDPANAGKLDVSSLHIGTTLAGNRFNQAYPKFEESIMVPYFEFASRAFPDQDVADAALLLSKGTTTPDQNDTSLPDTQALPAHNSHNSVTADISLATISSASSSTPDTSLATVSPDTSLATVSPDTSLTTDTSLTFMALQQYNPTDAAQLQAAISVTSPSPMEFSSTSSGMDWFASSRLSPLTSTSRLGDLNSAGPLGHDSDNALTTLQSQASPPHLRHILTKTATANSYASAPNNNPFAPMATSSLAHSPTSVEIPSVQPSSVVPEPPTMEPIMATPSPPATVGGVLPATTKAAKRKSTKSNETVSAKCQKREGAVVLPTENSQPIEGGRGKRQRFQSSRAAAANAIGHTFFKVGLGRALLARGWYTSMVEPLGGQDSTYSRNLNMFESPEESISANMTIFFVEKYLKELWWDLKILNERGGGLHDPAPEDRIKIKGSKTEVKLETKLLSAACIQGNVSTPTLVVEPKRSVSRVTPPCEPSNLTFIWSHPDWVEPRSHDKGIDRQTITMAASNGKMCKLITNSVTGKDIELSCTIKLVICYQVYLLLYRQLQMARCVTTNSVTGKDIELSCTIKLVICYQAMTMSYHIPIKLLTLNQIYLVIHGQLMMAGATIKDTKLSSGAGLQNFIKMTVFNQLYLLLHWQLVMA